MPLKVHSPYAPRAASTFKTTRGLMEEDAQPINLQRKASQVRRATPHSSTNGVIRCSKRPQKFNAPGLDYQVVDLVQALRHLVRGVDPP